MHGTQTRQQAATEGQALIEVSPAQHTVLQGRFNSAGSVREGLPYLLTMLLGKGWQIAACVGFFGGNTNESTVRRVIDEWNSRQIDGIDTLAKAA